MTTIPGPITLTWRGNELFAGTLSVGFIRDASDTRLYPDNAAWVAVLMPGTARMMITNRATKSLARSALIEAVTKALGGQDG